MKYRGIAQLVARGIWDAEAGSSSLPTPTSSERVGKANSFVCAGLFLSDRQFLFGERGLTHGTRCAIILQLSDHRQQVRPGYRELKRMFPACRGKMSV